MKQSSFRLCIITLWLVLPPLLSVASESGASKAERTDSTQQQLLEEAEAVRQEAQRTVQEARLAAGRAAEETDQAADEGQQAAGVDARQTEELTRMREELGRAHEQLREVSRQVAQAHRELERAEPARLNDPRGRAFLGVLLGDDNENGVRIIGVSPDGPADRAGLQQGDVLVALNEVRLGQQVDGARSALLQAMNNVSPGDELALEVLRDGKSLKYKVVAEQRESRGWQTLLRIPEGPMVPGGARIIVDDMEIPLPTIDEARLADRIGEINAQLRHFNCRPGEGEGETIDFAPGPDIDEESFSRLGQIAMGDADFWFGLPQARGLELAGLNPDLGRYFKAQQGVLVIQARAGNAYGLQSGDVIQTVDKTRVNSPADLLRALREVDPGTEIELGIKRDRRDQKLQAKVPENRLGLIRMHRMEPPAAPAVAD